MRPRVHVGLVGPVVQQREERVGQPQRRREGVAPAGRPPHAAELSSVTRTGSRCRRAMASERCEAGGAAARGGRRQQPRKRRGPRRQQRGSA